MDIALQKEQVYCRSVQGFPLVTCTLIRRYLCFQISHLASNNMFLVGSFLGGLLLGFSVWQLLQFPLTSKHHALTILLRYLIRKSIYVIRLGVRWCVHPTRNVWFNSKNQKVLKWIFTTYAQCWSIQCLLKHFCTSQSWTFIVAAFMTSWLCEIWIRIQRHQLCHLSVGLQLR